MIYQNCRIIGHDEKFVWKLLSEHFEQFQENHLLYLYSQSAHKSSLHSVSKSLMLSTLNLHLSFFGH